MEQHNPVPVIHLPHHYLRPVNGYSTRMPTIGRYAVFELQYGGDSTLGASPIHSFPEGSPSLHYPQDHEYHYVLESGEGSTSVSLSPPRHATGVTNSKSDLYPEDVPPYQHPLSSSTHPLDASLSLLGPDPGPFPHKSSPSSSHGSSNMLPTPSEMAIIMTPTTERASSPYRLPPSPPVAVNEREGISPPSLETEITLPRERRHGCSMCHKKFDRPSTLKKHLLVHTGEKAFQCETCGRRFGVASNLNRHVRRCILKPVNALSINNSSSPESEPGHTRSSASSSPVNSNSGKPTHVERPLTLTTTITTASNARSPSQKRRRRAPSPSRWIPNSLLNFNIEISHQTVSVPLPPVSPSEWEERNSYDENVSTSPYHPREWQKKPQLPGPGLGFGSRGMRGYGMGAGRVQTYGSLLVF